MKKMFLKMRVCEGCGKRIDEYGTSFVKIEVVKNTQSQGFPETYAEKTVESCSFCVLEALKNLLIGSAKKANADFEEYMKK